MHRERMGWKCVHWIEKSHLSPCALFAIAVLPFLFLCFDAKIALSTSGIKWVVLTLFHRQQQQQHARCQATSRWWNTLHTQKNFHSFLCQRTHNFNTKIIRFFFILFLWYVNVSCFRVFNDSAHRNLCVNVRFCCCWFVFMALKRHHHIEYFAIQCMLHFNIYCIRRNDVLHCFSLATRSIVYIDFGLNWWQGKCFMDL